MDRRERARACASLHGLTSLFSAEEAAIDKKPFEAVDPKNEVPMGPEWDDLMNLFALVRQRRVTQILEFGCGYSTSVFAHALILNDNDYGSHVRSELRRSNPFHLNVVDDMEQYAEITESRLSEKMRKHVSFHVSSVRMTTFNDRICTEYEKLPNICPDFIYLDGPSQDSATGDVNGISTRHADRLPMACDILRMEHFLLPGTLIVVDGRTANARFLKANFQREWRHKHDLDGDVHYFELAEHPLGKLNRLQLEYCLGSDWHARPLRTDFEKLPLPDSDGA